MKVNKHCTEYSNTVKSLDIIDLTVEEFVKLQMGLKASIEKKETFLKSSEKNLANFDTNKFRLFDTKEEYIRDIEETKCEIKILKDLLYKLENKTQDE